MVRPFAILSLVLTALLASAVPPLAAAWQSVTGAELVGYAVLPADTFAPGPPSGAFNANGEQGAPQFRTQPVQGFSGIRPRPDDSVLVLADNGFGSRKNSPDFELRIYTVRPDLRTASGGSGSVRVDPAFIALRDPDRRVNFLLVNETTTERRLTGGDFDPESLVVLPDGTFWVGDEFGPFLLHFDATGRLMAPPMAVPDPRPGKDVAKDVVRSPDNPFLSPPRPGQVQIANADRSKGLESLALGADGTRMYALIEGTLAGDPAGQLRILEFALPAATFTGRSWTYQMQVPAHAVRDMATVNATQFLVIEGDGGHGKDAQDKKIFLIDLARKDASGHVTKELVVDLMSVRDPRNLAGYGAVFTFPYETIEGLAVLDASTLVVVNDNNYPGTGARRAKEIDHTEYLRLRLDRPLALDPRLAVK